MSPLSAITCRLYRLLLTHFVNCVVWARWFVFKSLELSSETQGMVLFAPVFVVCVLTGFCAMLAAPANVLSLRRVLGETTGTPPPFRIFFCAKRKLATVGNPVSP